MVKVFTDFYVGHKVGIHFVTSFHERIVTIWFLLDRERLYLCRTVLINIKSRRDGSRKGAYKPIH